MPTMGKSAEDPSCFGGLFWHISNKGTFLLMSGGYTAFIWIQYHQYNPSLGHLEINETHWARCVLHYCQDWKCCEVLQLRKDTQVEPLVFLTYGPESRPQVTTLFLMYKLQLVWEPPNTSTMFFHASGFYSIEVQVYNRGIISVKGLRDRTYGLRLARQSLWLRGWCLSFFWDS